VPDVNVPLFVQSPLTVMFWLFDASVVLEAIVKPPFTVIAPPSVFVDPLLTVRL
jgi:hypothetical protein